MKILGCKMKKIFCFFIFCLILVLTEMAVASKKIRFVQVTDVHYSDNLDDRGSRMLRSSGRLLDDAIKQINNIDNLLFINNGRFRWNSKKLFIVFLLLLHILDDLKYLPSDFNCKNKNPINK